MPDAGGAGARREDGANGRLMSSSNTRKPDRYEARARELSLAAGVDPDSRIERPGQRSMPAWCAYRAECLVTETAAVAAELPPQGPEYRDAPLKVIGEHDEGTVAQMRNCMGVGNVVAGVICADGHLGYAQPVGGVIAYEKQISISGGRLRYRLRQHGGEKGTPHLMTGSSEVSTEAA